MERTINRVAGYRTMLKMSQKEMAQYLEISPQSYSNKERGFRKFTDKEKLDLKKLFIKIDSKITIDTIFF